MRSGDRQLVIQARRAVLPDGTRPAEVRISAGLIDEVGPITSPPGPRAGLGGQRAGPGGERVGPGGARVITLADDEVLLPGLVDTHVHVNEPGRTDWEGFATATRAAAAGGITTIVDMPLNSIPPTTNAASLRIKREEAAGQAHVDVSPRPLVAGHPFEEREDPASLLGRRDVGGALVPGAVDPRAERVRA